MFRVLDTLEDAIDKVAGSEAHVDVARMHSLIERLEHAWLERVHDGTQRGDWQAEGFVSAPAWLRERCRLTRGAATAAIDLARKLASLPETSDAFARGAITRAHAQVIARAATPERADAISEVEPSTDLGPRTAEVGSRNHSSSIALK
jgi:3-methyladenine DNA glycosylase/8-oxoguanine DNA glycosylase